MEINLDDIDFKVIRILKSLKEKEGLHTTQLAQKVFELNKDDSRQIKRGFQKLKYRLYKLAEMGLVDVVRKKSGTYYDLIGDNVKFNKFSFPNSKKQGIALCCEGKWVLIEN